MANWDTPASDRPPTTPRNPPTPAAWQGTSTPAHDSPHPDSPETPPPLGVHGDIELELVALANALYNLGTTAINDNSREKFGPDGSRPEKKMGARVNDVVEHLAAIEDLSQTLDTLIPMQVITEIDNGRNPMQVTRERIERAALENQFINGKLDAIESYTQLLDDALCQHFPELTPYLRPQHPPDFSSQISKLPIEADANTLPSSS